MAVQIAARVLLVDDTIRILEKVHFARGSAQVWESAIGLVDAIAQVLVEEQIRLVAVLGHASRGERRPASRRPRASAVLAVLVARGASPERLVAESFGLERPIETVDPSGARDCPESCCARSPRRGRTFDVVVLVSHQAKAAFAFR